MKKTDIFEQFFISSPIGLLAASIKQEKLYSISRANQTYLFVKRDKILKIADKDFSYIVSEASQKIIKQQKLSAFAQKVKYQLHSYFKGELRKFHIPLFVRGTDFQKKVWKALQNIPWGQTKTYGQLADQLNISKGSRAVGNGCAKNPFLIIVPCHRVLSKKGLGGFALGLKTKKQLLALECCMLH